MRRGEPSGGARLRAKPRACPGPGVHCRSAARVNGGAKRGSIEDARGSGLREYCGLERGEYRGSPQRVSRHCGGSLERTSPGQTLAIDLAPGIAPSHPSGLPGLVRAQLRLSATYAPGTIPSSRIQGHAPICPPVVAFFSGYAAYASMRAIQLQGARLQPPRSPRRGGALRRGRPHRSRSP